MIQFQDELIRKINSFTLDSFPHTIILSGAKGCGRHEVCRYISEKFALPLVDLSTKPVAELKDSLDETYEKISPSIYVLDTAEFGITSIQKQNVLLKFIEEPLKNVFVILLTENSNHLLATVVNRCQIFNFETYTREQLRTFTGGNDDLLEICTTPGEVIDNLGTDVMAMKNLAQLLFEKIGVATYQNALSIANKLNFKNESEKFDFTLFVRILVKCSTENVIKHSDVRFQSSSKLTTKLARDVKNTNINKRYIFEQYLINLKKIWI